MGNMFENHDLVVQIHNTLRDHGVLKNDAPLNTLTSEQRAFLEAVDKDIENVFESERQQSYDDGYKEGHGEGFDEGRDEGYDVGHADGVNEASK